MPNRERNVSASSALFEMNCKFESVFEIGFILFRNFDTKHFGI